MDGEREVEAVVKVPSNLMMLIRQSYDTREKVLDWMLAIAVAATMVYVFRDQLRGFVTVVNDPEAGCDDIEPNMRVTQARDVYDAGQGQYTYNLPRSRNIRNGIGPSTGRLPQSPNSQPSFPE